MEKAQKVFKLADLQKIDPQLFLTRFNEGVMEIPEFPGLLFHYEGLHQTILSYIYAEANGNAGLLFSLAGQCGLTAMTVNGERCPVDTNTRYMGLNRDIILRTVDTEDWNGLPLVMQQAIGVKVLEASSLTEEERVKLAFSPPFESNRSGATVEGLKTAQHVVTPATDSGASVPAEATVKSSPATAVLSKPARSNRSKK